MMKIKKNLSLFLVIAMILSTMSFPVIATEEIELIEEIELVEETELEEEFGFVEETELEEVVQEDEVSLAGDEVELFAANELYVSYEYNSSTEGYGVTKFSNYAGAYAYATANNKTATIVIEKTNTLSGNTFDNNHKNYSKLAVVIKDGATMGNAASKWDMTYPVTVEAGGTLTCARPANASVSNIHIKNTLTIGTEGSDKKAYCYLLSNSYQDCDISIRYNGKVILHNAVMTVQDLDAQGTFTVNNSEITVDGAFATTTSAFYATTLNNSTMQVKGTPISGGLSDSSGGDCNQLGKVNLNDSSITFGEGSTVKVAGNVTVSGTSAIEADTLTVNKNKKVIVNDTAVVEVGTLTNNGKIEVGETATITVDAVAAESTGGVTLDGVVVVFDGGSFVPADLKIGDKGFKTLDEALTYAEANNMTEVVIDLFADAKYSDKIKNFKKITFNGTNREQTFDLNINSNIEISTELVFNNLTVSRLDKEWLYHYTYIAGGLTFNNCKMIGLFNVTAQDTDFIGCDFYNDDTFGDGNYSIWIYNCFDGVEVNITDCTFDVYERAIKMYGNGYEDTMTLNISGTEFVSRTADKTVVEMAYSNANGIGKMNLNIEDSEATGFGAPEHIAGEANAWFNVEGTEGKVYSTVYVDGEKVYTDVVAKINGEEYLSLAEALNAAEDGDTIELLNDATLNATTNINKSFTINGNGKKIAQAEGFVRNGANAMLDIFGGATVNFENVVFDGIKDVAIMRTVDASVVIDNCVVSNCEHTVAQGLLRLACGNATITNSKFINNDCTMVISFGYDAANDTDVLKIDGCLFEGNTCGETAVVYFAAGDYATVTDTKFINNKVTSAGNATTLYMGWGDGFEVSGCTFKGNSVATTHATTKRFASAIFCDGCTVNENVFVDNTATRNGEKVATTVAVAAYYGDAEISKNYWNDGTEPVKGVAYTVEYDRNPVEIESYYTILNDDGTPEELAYTTAVALLYKPNTMMRSSAWILVDCFDTLEEAFAAAGEGYMIKLIADVELEETVTVPAGAEVILDLNGKTITAENCEAIETEANSTLTVQDNGTESEGKIIGEIVNNGTLSVESGSFSDNVNDYTPDGFKSVTKENTGLYYVVPDYIVTAIADVDSAVAGDTITVDVKVTDGGAYTNASWTLKYDPTYVTYTGNDAENYKITGSVTDGNTDNGIDEFDETTVLGTYTFTVNGDVLPGTAVFEIVSAEVHNYKMVIDFDGVAATGVSDSVNIVLKAGEGEGVTGQVVPYNGVEQRGNEVTNVPTGARVTYSTDANNFANGTQLPPAFVNVGTYTYYAKVEADGYAEKIVEQTLTIEAIAVNPTVEWSVAPESDYVGYTPVITGVLDETYTGTVTVFNGNELIATLDADDFTYDGHGRAVYKEELVISGVTSGNLTLTVKYTAGADDNYATSEGSATVNVDKSTIDEATEDALEAAIIGEGEVTYDGTLHFVDVDTSALPDGWEAFVARHDGVTNFGDINVVDVTFKDTTGKYNDYTATVVIKTIRRIVTITVNNATKKNGQLDSEATNWRYTAVASIIGNDLGDVTIVRVEEGEIEGTYEITATYTPNNNYIVSVVNGTLTITDAVYVVEVVDNKYNLNAGLDADADYTVGSRMILVHTDSDYAFFTYNGKKMYDVSEAGYTYFEHDYDTNTHREGKKYQHVYAIVVEAEHGYAETEANEDLYARNVKYAGKDTNASYAPVKITYDADINGMEDLHINDYSAVKGIYNSIYDYDKYQVSILKADFNKNKIVNTADAQAVKDLVK